jgi:hypothetical protein
MPAWAMVMLMAYAGGCSSQSGDAAHQPPPSEEKIPVTQERPAPDPVPGLPFAQGRAFASLDDYLAFLRERGRYDVPWYREVRPGVYELVARRGPGAEPETYTREELARKFGFAR